MTGLFISFEGGEGSGKTTQIAKLSHWLETRWPAAVTLTREPGGTEGAELVRQLLVTGDAGRWDAMTEALLMTAARRDNVWRLIKPALERGEAVISDRFFDSTTVYQGVVGGADMEVIATLNSRSLGGITPDYTFLLDIPPETGLQRSTRADNTETRFEQKGLAFHKQVREAYQQLAETCANRIHLVDADKNEEEIHQQIVSVLENKLSSQLATIPATQKRF